MAGFDTTPKFVLRLMHLPPRALYALGLGPLIGRLLLLLTTIGRKTGKARVTPLQYEEIDGCIYLGAALGQRADWVRNIRANPAVEVRVKGRRFHGTASIINDCGQIADFLEVRLQRHPRMVGAILRGDGVSLPPTRAALEQYARGLTLVVVREE